MCVFVCVRVRVRACVRACVHRIWRCINIYYLEKKGLVEQKRDSVRHQSNFIHIPDLDKQIQHLNNMDIKQEKR